MVKHFKWKEVVYSDTANNYNIDNTPDYELMDNILSSFYGIEKVRELIGVPIKVTSWFRCKELNNKVGGVSNSAHLKGFAIDFIPIGMTIADAYKIISGSKIKYDQLILEPSWIHISFAPEMRCNYFIKSVGTGKK